MINTKIICRSVGELTPNSLFNSNKEWTLRGHVIADVVFDKFMTVVGVEVFTDEGLKNIPADSTTIVISKSFENKGGEIIAKGNYTLTETDSTDFYSNQSADWE